MASALLAAEAATDGARDRSSLDPPAFALEDEATAASGSPIMGWRSFHSALQCAAASAVQTGAPLSILMIELVWPEQSGEQGGAADAVPTGALANLIEAAVEGCGSVARYTEQQLAVIMTETDLGGALARAQRIGRRLASRPGRPPGEAGAEPLPAIGIAQFKDDESLGHLIQRASDALGRARTERGPAVVVDCGVKARPVRTGSGLRPALPATPSGTDDRNREAAA